MGPVVVRSSGLVGTFQAGSPGLASSAQVVERERAVILGKRNVADVVAFKIGDALGDGQGGECLAGVDPSGEVKDLP